jgi:MFS family permease
VSHATIRPARRVVVVRTLRGFADGFVSVLLASHLVHLGFSPLQIGVLVTGTLVGSAVLTLVVGFGAHRLPFRTLLVGAAVLMTLTGIGFLTFTTFVPLLVVAVVGTLNPSSGDVSVFLPSEQAYLALHATGRERTKLYALYGMGGNVAGAAGALLTAVVHGRVGFLVYLAVAVTAVVAYRALPVEPVVHTGPRRALHRSRRTVFELTALFSLDAAAGGFAVTSLLVLWLHLRFGLSTVTTGAVFFAVGLLAATSQLLAPRVAERVGLVRTMVFTHLPASALLVLVALAPNAPVAVTLLLLRSAFAQMDVPARQALVMAAVAPEERAAAASVTNVPRSLAAASTPAFAGWLLAHGHLAAPLVLAGVGKATYDLVLLRRFGALDLPEADELPRS